MFSYFIPNVDSGQRNLEEVPNLSEVPSGDLSDGISDCASSDSLENDILMGDVFREEGSNALATTSNTTMTTVPSEDSIMSSPGSERLQMRKEKVYLDEADWLRKMFRHDLVLAQEKAKLHAAQVASKLKERAQLERNQKLLELARAEVEEDPEIVELRRLMAVSAQASAKSLTELRKLNEAEVVKPKKKKAKTF